MTRLRLGKCKLNYDMYRIGLHANGLCDACQQPETVEQYLMKPEIEYCTTNRVDNREQEESAV